MKKHILFLTPGFPGDENESDCIPALQVFLLALKKLDQFEIQVLSFHYPYDKRTYSWNGIPVYAIGGANRKGLGRLKMYAKVWSKAKAIHVKRQFDHVHSFWLGECSWMGSRIAKQYGLPHSCTLMGQDVLKNNKFFKRIKRKPQFIALSEFHARTFYNNYNIQASMIIPWGIEKGEAMGTIKKTIDVLGVGNLIKLKKFDEFVQIISRLKEDIPAIKAVIIGQGPEKNGLIKQIDALGLNEQITLSGQLSREEVLRKMGESRCFLHCSAFESFGMVVIEALEQGAYVVAKKVGIAAEVEQVVNYSQNEEAVDKLRKMLLSEKEAPRSMSYPIEHTATLYAKRVFLK